MLTFAVYLFRLVFKYRKIYYDWQFFETHRLKLFEVYIYKSLEILLLEQYARRNPTYSEEKVDKKVTEDLYYVYCEYFKLKK